MVQVTEQQIMDAMIVANRHGHIACTQGGECLAGLVNARALGLVGDDEHAVLDATAHALKFSGFQDMYFNDSFPEAYGVKPQAELSNKPELLLPESAREGKDVATFARMGADAVVAEGTEAGGHIGELTTMALVPSVCAAVSIPVIAAGGIASGRQLAAAYALGACGRPDRHLPAGQRGVPHPPQLQAGPPQGQRHRHHCYRPHHRRARPGAQEQDGQGVHPHGEGEHPPGRA